MSNNIVSPEFRKGEFSCPYCSVHSAQYWVFRDDINTLLARKFETETGNRIYANDFAFSICLRCKNLSMWIYSSNKKLWWLAFPGKSSPVPLPNEDMPDEIKADYLEARSIVMASPRGAAALLRLCIQKLMPILGEKGENLNDDIGSLVKKGLRPEIQMALDSVRVIGNEAVHPGVLDLNDDPDTALAMFDLLNLIVDHAITAKKKAKTVYYSSVPQSKRDAISRRDGKQAEENTT